MLSGRVGLPAGAPIRPWHAAHMGKPAIAAGAGPHVVSHANLALCSLRVHNFSDPRLLAFPGGAAFLPRVFCFGATPKVAFGLRSERRARAFALPNGSSRLQITGDVLANFGDFMEGLIQGVALAGHLPNCAPQLLISKHYLGNGGPPKSRMF